MPAFTEALSPALKSERLLTTVVEDRGPGPQPPRPIPWRALALMEMRPHPLSGAVADPGAPLQLPTELRTAGRREAGGEQAMGRLRGRAVVEALSSGAGTWGQMASKAFPLISIQSALK